MSWRCAVCVLAVTVACGGPASQRAASGSGRVRDCPGAVVADAAELRALAGCRLIGGDLTITGATLESLDGLESLQLVQGSVIIGPTTALLATTGLDNLRSIGGALRIEDNASLASVSLPVLGGVRGGILIDTNHRLAVAATPRLRWADSVDVSNNDALIEVHLPRVEMVPNGVRISDNRALRSIGVTLLRSAGELVVMTNPALVEIIAPRLEELEGGLEVELNPALVSVELPSLRQVGGVVLLQGNDALSTATAMGLADGIAVKGAVRIDGNGP